MSEELPVCPVCTLPVYLEGATIHPCCEFAWARGEDCGGCRGFKARVRDGLA